MKLEKIYNVYGEKKIKFIIYKELQKFSERNQSSKIKEKKMNR